MKGQYFEMNSAANSPEPSFTPIEAVPNVSEEMPIAQEKKAEAQFRDSSVGSDPPNTYLQVSGSKMLQSQIIICRLVTG